MWRATALPMPLSCSSGRAQVRKKTRVVDRLRAELVESLQRGVSKPESSETPATLTTWSNTVRPVTTSIWQMSPERYHPSLDGSWQQTPGSLYSSAILHCESSWTETLETGEEATSLSQLQVEYSRLWRHFILPISCDSEGCGTSVLPTLRRRSG